jgi:hypothetical protein
MCASLSKRLCVTGACTMEEAVCSLCKKHITMEEAVCYWCNHALKGMG